MEKFTAIHRLLDHHLAEWYLTAKDDFIEDTFTLGYFLADLGTYVAVQAINLDGSLDAITLFLKDDIVFIKFDTAYTKMFENYVKINKAQHTFDPYHLLLEWDKLKAPTFLAVLFNCFRQQRVISMMQNDGDYLEHGQIIMLTENFLTLNEAKYLADVDGKMCQNQTTKISQIVSLDILSRANYIHELYLKNKKV
jgi:hypothetical protein